VPAPRKGASAFSVAGIAKPCIPPGGRVGRLIFWRLHVIWDNLLKKKNTVRKSQASSTVALTWIKDSRYRM
jgi:hypothetical protein